MGTIRVTMRIGVQGPALEHLAEGESYDLPEAFARDLVHTGRAVPVAPLPQLGPLVAGPSGTIVNADPVAEHRDPAPAKKRK